MRRQRIILPLVCIYILVLVILFCPIFSKEPKPGFGNPVLVDKHSVLELHPEFISSECRSGRIRLMTIVTSSVENFAERAAVRDTWGSITGFDDHQFRLVFVLENTTPKYLLSVIRNLTIESETFGDLLVQPETTARAPGTAKEWSVTSGLAAGLSWMDITCTNVKMVLKATDSYFINMIGFYWNILKKGTLDGRRRTLICFGYAEPTTFSESSPLENEVRRCLTGVFLLSKPLSGSFSNVLSSGYSWKTVLQTKTSVVDMAFARANSSSQIISCVQKFKTGCKLVVGVAKPHEMRTLWLDHQ